MLLLTCVPGWQRYVQDNGRAGMDTEILPIIRAPEGKLGESLPRSAIMSHLPRLASGAGFDGVDNWNARYENLRSACRFINWPGLCLCAVLAQAIEKLEPRPGCHSRHHCRRRIFDCYWLRHLQRRRNRNVLDPLIQWQHGKMELVWLSNMPQPLNYQHLPLRISNLIQVPRLFPPDQA